MVHKNTIISSCHFSSYHGLKYNIYTVVFKIIAVFKKASKAQNPFNNFYFNTHKCIGNIAYFILNQNMKKHLSNVLLLYRK